MLPSKLAEQVAEKINSMPSDKRHEVMKSLESFVAEATRVAPRKYTGTAWASSLPESESEEPRPDVWRFTVGPSPNPFEE